MLGPAGEAGVPLLVRDTITGVLPTKETPVTPNIYSIMRDHVSLTVSCIDRLYLHGYIPRLQTSGQLCYFLREHLGNPIPSPALFRPLNERFAESVKSFVEREQVPLIHFQPGQRKDDVVAPYRQRFKGREGVVLVGVAQEKMSSFKAQKRRGPQGGVSFDFSRQPVAVNHYYFYLHDRQWGPAFIKFGTYLPYPIKLCLNGHEWVKQQLRREHIGFEALDNGFLSCRSPERLQAVCDRLSPVEVQQFFARWSQRLPWPLTAADRAAGFMHRLAIWQLEVSLTQVFDRPVQGRHFFEAVIRENLDLGRPERVGLLFPLRLNRATPAPTHGWRTRVITVGVAPSLHVEYKRSHIKQYFKEQRALRTETTINDPRDFHLAKNIDNLTHLRDLGRQVNRKLLEAERLSEHCTLTQQGLDRLQQSSLHDGQRAPGLRFGNPRAMALLQGLTAFAHLPQGFRNGQLRERVAALLGHDYSTAQMTYDLRRLRLKGLTHRLPGTHRYTATTYGLKVAFFYSKLYLRILRPHWPALLPEDDQLPRPLRAALDQLQLEIEKIYDHAALKAA
jgi:hypothetical protein